jgi:preprotein translocase subunit SecG
LSGSFMQTVVILIHLMIVLAMVGLVLIQKSEGGGLGMGGGSGGGFMSNRGTANVLTRATGILAALFFATSLFLSILASFDRKPRSILEGGSTPAVPGAPAVPGGPGGGVLNQLGGAPQQTPAAPPTPSGPQVPRQ